MPNIFDQFDEEEEQPKANIFDQFDEEEEQPPVEAKAATPPPIPLDRPPAYGHPRANLQKPMASAGLFTGLAQGAVDTVNFATGAPSALSGAVESLFDDEETALEGLKRGYSRGAMIPDIPRVIPEGESTTADVLQTFGEWAMPIGKATKIDAFIGSMAAAGEQAAGDKGELGAGFFATFLSLLKRKPVTEQAEAIEYIKNSGTQDADTLAAKVQKGLDEGEKGTLADLTQDTGLIKAEHIIEDIVPQAKERIQAIAEGREAQAISQIEDVTGVAPDRFVEPAKVAAGERVNALEQTIAQQQQKTATAADRPLQQTIEAEAEIMRDIDPNMQPSQASVELDTALEQGQRALEITEEVPAWKKFDEGADFNSASLVSDMKDFADASFTKVEMSQVKKVFPDLYKRIFGIKGTQTPKDVGNVISAIGAKLDSLRRTEGTVGVEGRTLAILKSEFENKFKVLAPDYKAAKEATKKIHDQYKPRLLKKSRGVSAESVAGKIFDTGEAGATRADELLRSTEPNILSKMETYIKSIVTKKGLDKGFNDNYSEFLDRFPRLQKQLTEARAAQDKVTEATQAVADAGVKADKSATQLGKTLKAKTVSKFRANPQGTVKTLLKDNDLTALKQLQKDMGRVEGGGAKLNDVITDSILSSIVNTKGNKRIITPKSLSEFNDIKKNLVDAGLLSLDEVTAIEKQLAKSEFAGLKKSLRPMKIKNTVSAVEDVMAIGASIVALKFIPTTNNRIMLASGLKKFFTKMFAKDLDASNKRKVALVIEDIMTNPQKFVAHFDDMKNISQAHVRDVLQRLVRAADKPLREEDNE